MSAHPDIKDGVDSVGTGTVAWMGARMFAVNVLVALVAYGGALDPLQATVAGHAHLITLPRIVSAFPTFGLSAEDCRDAKRTVTCVEDAH